MEQADQIQFEDFLKVEIRVGMIKEAGRMEGSTKMIKLAVDFGELGDRQVLTGLGATMEPEEFTNKKVCFVFNVKPRRIMGLESQAIIMGTDEKEPKLLLAPESAGLGSRII